MFLAALRLRPRRHQQIEDLEVCANARSFRGTLSLVPEGACLALVNTLPLDSYLREVVPRESPVSGGDVGGGRGMAAPPARAVAARSLAPAENRYPATPRRATPPRVGSMAKPVTSRAARLRTLARIRRK
jgi:hypothetical protein